MGTTETSPTPQPEPVEAPKEPEAAPRVLIARYDELYVVPHQLTVENLSRNITVSTSRFSAWGFGVHRPHLRSDRRTFQTELRKSSKSDAARKISKKKPILLVKRLINSRGQFEGKDIDILSQPLLQVFLDINEDVEGLDLTVYEPTVCLTLLNITNNLQYLQAKQELFFHSRAKLIERLAEEEAKKTRDEETILGIQTALQYIAEDLTNTISNFDILTSQGEITYQLLWALFPPNTYVRVYHHHTEQELVMYARNIAYVNTSQRSYAAITCDIITNDGKTFGIAQEVAEIDEFRGSRPIRDLPVYPLDCHLDKDDLFNHAVKRGKQFASITRHFYDCSGFAVVDPKTADEKAQPVKSSVGVHLKRRSIDQL